MTLTPPADQAALGTVRSLVALGNEVGKGLRHAWAERVQILIELPLFLGVVLLFSLLLDRGEQVAAGTGLTWSFDPYRTTWLVLGFTVFTFVYLQSVKTFWRLLGEIQTGTLEQSYLSPLPAWVNVAAGRLTAAVIETAIVVGMLYGVISLVVDLQLSWRVEALAPLVLALVGGTGYSLVVAGLTLAWKRVELLQEMVLTLVMAGSGALIPLQSLPGWVSVVGDLLFITHPIEALRTVMLDDQSLPVAGTGGWAWMIGTATTWLAIGVASFMVGSRYATHHGSLTRYR
jgi:ABC-2 type transport system permease protein